MSLGLRDTSGCHSLDRLGGTPQLWSGTEELWAGSRGWAEGKAVGQGVDSKGAAELIFTINVDEARDEAKPLGRLSAEPLAEAAGEGLGKPCPAPHPHPSPPFSPPGLAGAWHWRLPPPTVPAAPVETGGVAVSRGGTVQVPGGCVLPWYLLSREDDSVLAQHRAELVHEVLAEAVAVGTQP